METMVPNLKMEVQWGTWERPQDAILNFNFSLEIDIPHLKGYVWQSDVAIRQC